MGCSEQAITELRGLRSSLHQCFAPWGDALFELCDTTLCAAAPVGSVPSLGLEPEFRRSHGSLYKALAEGEMDTVRLRQLLVEHRSKDWPLVFAVDASTWDRCDAESARAGFPLLGLQALGRTAHRGRMVLSVDLPAELGSDSWTAPLDALRITPSIDAFLATVEQVKRLVDLLPDDGDVPLFVFDAG